MTTTPASRPVRGHRAHASHRATTRAAGAAGAVGAALAVWAIAVPGLGVHLMIRFGPGTPHTVQATTVGLAALAASLLGWGALALLERRTVHAWAIWTIAALGALAVSFSMPLLAGTTPATKASLAIMHAAVAAVLIPTFARSATTKGATS